MQYIWHKTSGAPPSLAKLAAYEVFTYMDGWRLCAGLSIRIAVDSPIFSHAKQTGAPQNFILRRACKGGI